MRLKNNVVLLLILSLILWVYPLISKAHIKLFKSNFLLTFSKNNTQKTTSNTNRSNVSEQVKKFRFPPLGSSRRVTTGATRTDTNILKILVPSITQEENSQSEFNIYSTYSEYPTFVIYFKNPQTIPKDTTIKFTLHNSDNSKINQTYFQVKNSGIYLFSLPNNQSALKTNINYSWQFSLVYGARNQYTLLSDQGSIQRQSIPVEIKQQLSGISDIEKLIIYGKNQIWYDTVSYLTNLYCLDNNTHKESWLNLLNSTDLNLYIIAIQDVLSCHDITFLADI
ncbi:MAG: DUF928 domain-containing protein [Xenococcaceae cyanobacterium MO_188.B19]|nr:DUF928 domain-containing protein [Xenococcaceae cyanobacterium MO_188.B19]